MPKSDTLRPRLQKALDYAIALHGKDARKKSQVPVLAHLLAVCALVQHDGGNEHEAVAALLHDALEDKPDLTSPNELRRRFGSRVLHLVQISTDTPRGWKGGPKPPWKERKTAYLAHVRRTNPKDLRVTVADKIDNVRAILADHRRLGAKLWKRFNAPKSEQLWYYMSVVKAYRTAGFKGPLLDELARLVRQLVKQAGKR